MMRRFCGKPGKENGSMVLEYVLMLSVGVVFLYCALQIFEPGRGFTEEIGKPMVAYFQRVLVGISLPVP
ncbi:MAG: hypothetical protein IKQ16_10115 [Lentisphaeria bacterium]|jgi:hypothetical protein|nr:hypothetical protein [Lentisphaeria bacterium]